MAKIIITVEDLPNGKVSVVANPSFETMCKIHVSGNTLTSAHGYAMTMMRVVRDVAKSQQKGIIVGIPRIGRA